MEVTVAQMKQLEREADAHGLSYTAMMENAGQAAAKVLLKKAPQPLQRVAVFCGSGNNGGDGFVLARALQQAGIQTCAILVDGEPKTADARLNWERAIAVPVEMWALDTLTEEQCAWVRTADAVVDALYGTGFHGALRPAGRKAADLFHAANGFKLALDLPSGLAADTGEAAEGAIQADCTVTFHAAKPCHRLAPNQCGTVEVVSIAIETVL